MLSSQCGHVQVQMRRLRVEWLHGQTCFLVASKAASSRAEQGEVQEAGDLLGALRESLR